jgi:hypothetical protein
MMLLRPLLFTALDCLPLWITSRGKVLLRFVHETTGVKSITVGIGHASVHEPGKKREKKVTTHHRLGCFI